MATAALGQGVVKNVSMKLYMEKNTNEEKFRNYFKYQNSSSLVKDFFKAGKNKSDKIKYMIINELIKLMEDIIIR